MNFVLNRDKTVSTLSGHIIEFKKGAPTYVPRACWEAVQAVGAVPEEELPEEPKVDNPEPTDADKRRDVIMDAMEQIVLRNRREDFTATGAPHARALKELLGFTVQNKERDTLWDKVQARSRGEED